jgi:hypothetical protein
MICRVEVTRETLRESIAQWTISGIRIQARSRLYRFFEKTGLRNQ